MRVINRETFLKMPVGTVYQKGKPWYWTGLCIKDESSDNDWWYTAIDDIESRDSGEQVERLERMRDGGASYAMDNALTRDGCFDDDDLFLIYEDDDLERLGQMIAEARKIK